MQIDGPPMAWFELNGEKIIYTTYALASLDNLGLLIQHADAHIRELERTGIVVWRRRPTVELCEAYSEVSFEDNSVMITFPERWKLVYRVAVIPHSVENSCMTIKEEGEKIALFV